MPLAASRSDASSSSGRPPAAAVVSITLPLSVSTCANASPVFESSFAPARTTAAASPARAFSPSSIVVSRFDATSRLSAIPAPVSSTAITPVKARVSLNRNGIRAIMRSSDPPRRPI